MTATIEPMPPVETLALAVLTEHERVTGNAWLDERWRVLGVVPTADAADDTLDRRVVRTTGDAEQFLWTGLKLVLRASEVDGYYHNLLGTTPHVYVLTQLNDDGEPVPVEISLEYSEALAYSEFGNESFAVPMPAELYRRVEKFVLEHYVPEEPRRKRKRDGETTRPRTDETKS